MVTTLQCSIDVVLDIGVIHDACTVSFENKEFERFGSRDVGCATTRLHDCRLSYVLISMVKLSWSYWSDPGARRRDFQFEAQLFIINNTFLSTTS